MSEGMHKEQAFEEAAKRMAGPVIAATLTRIAAFSPLLFWPGIVGDFMKYLPITLIVTLAASMAYALIFAPSIGAMIGKAPLHDEHDHRDGLYMAVVKKAVHYPITALVLTVMLLGGGLFAYVKFGNGVEFFPTVEPDYGLLYVHARGNLSLDEMDAATRIAEQRMLGWPGIKSVLTKVGKTRGGEDIPEDVVGVINYEFIDWRERKSAHQILDDLRVAMAGIPGVDVEVRVPDAGPPTGKAIQVQLVGAIRPASTTTPRGRGDASPRFPASSTCPTACRRPASTGRSRSTAPRRRSTASRPTSVGTVVQLVTTGLKLTDYRPAGADDAVDIRLRLPEDRRTLSALDQLRIETAQGSVPISNFVTRKPEPTVGILNRIDGKRTITIQANVASGFQVAEVQAAVAKVVGDMAKPGVDWKLAGSNEDSAEAGAFLSNAFGAAIFLIFIVLLAQFNKFTSVSAGAVLRRHGDDRRAARHAADRPDLRHRHVRHRLHRAGRRGGEQQHRADRHLRPAARGRLEQARRRAADLPRARPSGRADRAVGDPRRAADRLRPRAGDLPPRDDDQRAVDAVVDRAVVGDRVRPVLRDRADADRDAVDADGVHARQRARRASAATGSPGCSGAAGRSRQPAGSPAAGRRARHRLPEGGGVDRLRICRRIV